MHIEVHVALNFVISYLYNKLPRRRVNIFGEELEKALKEKFDGHWYPEKPFKGSAFRCLKTGDPVDTVFEKAARESGVPISDILEHLPSELAVWVDPGEVSYRIGEKGIVKILFSESGEVQPAEDQADREIMKTFNPEAQCFRPIESKPTSPVPEAGSPGTAPFKAPASPPPAFLLRSHHQLTFTTATFAQTKFGSTKLKTNNSKRANRMSPTEFSNYIKHRAAIQHQQQQQQALHSPGRSVSPDYNGLYNGQGYYRGGVEPFQHDQYQSKHPYVDWPYHGQQVNQQQGPDKQLLESLSNFSLGQPSSQFQHLLVAN